MSTFSFYWEYFCCIVCNGICTRLSAMMVWKMKKHISYSFKSKPYIGNIFDYNFPELKYDKYKYERYIYAKWENIFRKDKYSRFTIFSILEELIININAKAYRGEYIVTNSIYIFMYTYIYSKDNPLSRLPININVCNWFARVYLLSVDIKVEFLSVKRVRGYTSKVHIGALISFMLNKFRCILHLSIFILYTYVCEIGEAIICWSTTWWPQMDISYKI